MRKRVCVTALALFASVGLFAPFESASAATMDFNDLAVGPVFGPYSQNGLTLTPIATGSPAPMTHFDAVSVGAGNMAGDIHRGNDAEEVEVTFGGNPFNLVSVDIVGWTLQAPDTSLTATFTGSNGSTHSVSFNFAGTIDFQTLGGWTNLTSFTLSVPDLNKVCNANTACSHVIFDNIVTASTSDAPSPNPLPGTLPLFVSGLGAFSLLAWRRKRKA